MRPIISAIAVAAVLGVTAPLVLAQDAKQSIGARQGYMKLTSFYLGQLGAMAKGEVEYDAERAKMIAASLELVSQVDQSAMWPQGSDNAAMADQTRALPAIWETWPAVADVGAAYGEAVAALAASAGDGLEALQAGVGGVGKQCGACHDKFRAPQN